MRFHPDRNVRATELESNINKVAYEFVTEVWKELEDPEKKRRLESNGRFSPENGYSQASLRGEKTASQESWHKENSETEESENKEDN